MTMIFSFNIKLWLIGYEDLLLLVVQQGKVLGLGLAQCPGELLGFEMAESGRN